MGTPSSSAPVAASSTTAGPCFLTRERTPRMRRTPTAPSWRWMWSQTVEMAGPARLAAASRARVFGGMRAGRSSSAMRCHPRWVRRCSRSSWPVPGSRRRTWMSSHCSRRGLERQRAGTPRGLAGARRGLPCRSVRRRGGRPRRRNRARPGCRAGRPRRGRRRRRRPDGIRSRATELS